VRETVGFSISAPILILDGLVCWLGFNVARINFGQICLYSSAEYGLYCARTFLCFYLVTGIRSIRYLFCPIIMMMAREVGDDALECGNSISDGAAL